MITREDLQNKFAGLSNDELLEILDQKAGYTELALTVALEEIGKRDLSETDLNKYKDLRTEAFTDFIIKNILDDLSLLQKHLFYFVWFPLLNFPFRQNFRDDGCALKLKQANYYSRCGFAFFLLAGILATAWQFSDIGALGIWVAGMIPAYAFDGFFNKQSNIKRLRRVFNKNRGDKSAAGK